MSPRTPEQNAALREESRERILEAALSLFARHGYERTSVRMIAGEAGVAQGLMYNYFPGKEALLRAIFERGMGDVDASFDGAGGGDPEERLAALIRGSFAVVRGNREFWRLSYALRMQPGVLEGLGVEVQGWAEQIRSRLEALLGEAGVPDPALEARVLFAAIDGVAQHFVLDPGGYPLERVADLLCARYRALATTTGI